MRRPASWPPRTESLSTRRGDAPLRRRRSVTLAMARPAPPSAKLLSVSAPSCQLYPAFATPPPYPITDV